MKRIIGEIGYFLMNFGKKLYEKYGYGRGDK